MRITFVLPKYLTFPIGGYRVVYEYADYLAGRGHRVTIAFPRWQYAPGETISRLEPFKKRMWSLKIRLFNRPLVKWHSLHPKVRTALVPSIQDQYMPMGDIVVATAWRTAPSVASLSPSRGVKFYLIQSHETWDGPESEVNATWRLPLHKIVISKWLQDLGRQLCDSELRHIPNGIDLVRFRINTPPEIRPMSVLSLYSHQEVKGTPDALAVLCQYHKLYPDVPVSMFGVLPRDADLPDWIRYYENPKQDRLANEIYNNHAVYLGTSLMEGWALPPPEAMACGCAFVGTNIGGYRDYARDADTALLSPPGDRKGLLRNLIRVTEDTTLRNHIQQRGTKNIQQFTWQAAGNAMEAYFAEHVTTPISHFQKRPWLRKRKFGII